MHSTWKNWAGSVTCQPAARAHPTSLAEIVALVITCREQGLGLRVVGAGHSFTPLVATAGMLMSLDQYTGLEQVDLAASTVTVRAGTTLKVLGRLLKQHGLAQENLGDIDAQSIAGAISTGTHGTGLTMGSLATQVIGLTLVTAAGSVLRCSATEDRELFKAAQVSLGALGIIVSVTLRVIPAYRLKYTWQRESLEGCLATLEQSYSANRNFEFFWQPHTTSVLSKRMNLTQEPVPAALHQISHQLNQLVLENSAFWLLSEICRHVPAATPYVSGLIARSFSAGMALNDSHKILISPRLVKFYEMEYSLPIEALDVALRAIDIWIRRERFQVHFPLECRVVRADDIDLSPAYGRDSAYIAVHMYQGMPYQAYFAALETILRSYGGRPHWGKIHSLAAAELKRLYPQWDQFQQIRRQLDPTGIFLNPYLQTLFGLPDNETS